MTRNFRGLLQALQQSINEAILESKDVAAAMAALKRTGECPVFTVDISMLDSRNSTPGSENEPADDSANGPLIAQPVVSSHPNELVLSDWDVQFLADLGITDPSWSPSTPNAAYGLRRMAGALK